MPKTGRPKITISQDIFEALCSIQCTKAEIWHVLHVSEPTLRRWIRRTYGKKHTFDTIHENFMSEGKKSLRRAMFDSAIGGNVTAQIFLAKNYLGMSEKVEIDHSINNEIERELERLAAPSKTEIPAGITPASDAIN